MGRNVLHHAVIKNNTSIVGQLVELDTDFGKLRSMKDLK